MMRFMRWFTFYQVLGALLLSVPGAISAQNAEQSFDALLGKARQQGAVRLIVGVDVNFVPEGKLAAPGTIDGQRRAIAQAQERLLERVGRPPLFRRFRVIPYLAMEVDESTLLRLHTAPEVVSLVEDIPVPPTLLQSIPKIGADQVHLAGFTGAGQTVAVLDTGVDPSHPFFAGKVVAEACFSTTSPASGSTTVCPNGGSQQLGSGAGVPCAANIFGCDHGTHVAGIAVGKGAGRTGVAPDADLIAVQVFSRFVGAICQGSSPCVLSYLSDQIAGLERVHDLRNTLDIAAVNMSLGGGQFAGHCDMDPRQAIIATLRSVNIATVIASGNNGYTNALGAPACISGAVSVGATTLVDTVSSFSNSAFFLDLLAPGSGIDSSVPGGGFSAKSGTSMAAPHVAGAWAVLRQKAPNASVDDLLVALQTSGVAVVDSRNGLTKARIQLDSALLELACGPPTTGDWLVEEDCLFEDVAPAPANVIVKNQAVLTIAPQGALDIDFANHQLRVENASQVVVKQGGKLH